MDSENYFSSRYLTIVGHVQSGKTYEEINYCFASVKRGFPVFFITRNITADQLQLNARFIEFNKTLKNILPFLFPFFCLFQFFHLFFLKTIVIFSTLIFFSQREKKKENQCF